MKKIEIQFKFLKIQVRNSWGTVQFRDEQNFLDHQVQPLTNILTKDIWKEAILKGTGRSHWLLFFITWILFTVFSDYNDV